MLTGGQVAALIAAVFFAVLMLALSFLVLRLAKAVGQVEGLVVSMGGKVETAIVDITGQVVPLLGDVTTTVGKVNDEITRVDAITANVQSMSGNVSALTSLFAATLGSPIIKVAAFSYGVRSVASKRSEKDINKKVREELKSTRKSRR